MIETSGHQKYIYIIQTICPIIFGKKKKLESDIETKLGAIQKMVVGCSTLIDSITMKQSIFLRVGFSVVRCVQFTFCLML